MADDKVLFSVPAAPDVKTEVDSNQVKFIKLGYPDKPKVPPSPEDLSYLGDRDLPVQLSAEYGSSNFLNFRANEHVRLTLRGVSVNGTAVGWGPGYTVPTATDERTFYVPSDKLKALAGQTATLKYTVRSTDAQGKSKLRISDSVIFEVRGIALSPPVLVEAIGDTIDPDQISSKAKLNYVTVQLDYPDMAVGDTVRLVREGVDANQKAINFTDKDRPISASNLQRRPMTITWNDTDIKPLINGLMTIYYKVYRDGIWYTSPKRVFSVGPSLAGLPPFINEVHNSLLDPDQIADSVNLHIPSAGTVVGDKITLYWSDSSKQSFTDFATVTQQNVDGDLSFDIYLDNPINLNRGKVVTVFYKLERTLANGKKATYRSSDYKFFVGSQEEKDAADGRALAIPAIAGVENEVMDESLAEKGADMVVPFAETQEGDSVTAYWQVVGEAKPTALETKQVDSSNVSADLSFAIPATLIKPALNKKVIGYYVISRKGPDGKPQQFRSTSLPFSVGALAPSAQLPAPLVPAAQGGWLDPMDGINGTLVKIAPYPTIAVGDKVKVFWIGPDGAGAPDIAEQTVSDVAKALEFTVPGTAVGASIGSEEVWVYYEVTRAGLPEPIESDDTVIGVDLLGHDDLPEPVVEQAVGGTLDLGTAKGDLSVAISKWPFIAPGQRVWLRIEGTGKDGNPVQTVIWVARALSADDVKNGVRVNIERAKLEAFKDGSALKVFASLTHDGDFSDEYAEAFPVATVTIKQAKPADGAGAGAGASSGNEGVLIADVADVNLSAAYSKNGGPAPAGSSQLISVTGGTQPYTYRSADPNVAEVDANGLVMARGNGKTYIVVTDANGLVMNIEVVIKGILELIGLNFNIYARSNKRAVELGVTIPSLAEWQRMRADAGGTLQLELIEGKTPLVWTSTPGEPNLLGSTRIAFDYPSFELKELNDFKKGTVEMGGTAHGFGMKR